MAGRLLIIDDEEKLRSLLSRLLSLEGFEVIEAATASGAMRILEQHETEVILCDVKLPDANGVDLVIELKKISPQSEIIMLTAFGNIADGVRSIKNGAFDYITKGDDNDKIIPLIYRALEKVRMKERIVRLEKQVGMQYSFQNIIGNGPLIKKAIELAHKVASTDTIVLLTGETGTGKEVFAQSIHNESHRRTNSFVAVNCTAISKELLESELFGYKAGAFTGAAKDKKGLLDEAKTGTLFLDEIGEMPFELQAKLLRIIETGDFIPVGDTKSRKADVRIIAATNRDLKPEIANGTFRQDLFYRLSVFQVELPSLRQRFEDIPALSTYFMEFFSAKTNKKVLSIRDDAMHLLVSHDYPGNIRELKNIIERAVILCSNDEITIDDLPIEIQLTKTNPPNAFLSAFELASAEKLHILKVMNHTKGNKAEAARLLNIGIATLYRKLYDYKIST